MMTYRCSWLRLMVASAGEADRFSMKNKLSSISALCLLRTKMISFVCSPWLRWRRSRLSRWCNFITQLAMNLMFPRRRIDVGTMSQAVFHQCSLLVTHKDDILRLFTLVALETQSSFTLVQFYHTIGYEPNVSSKKDRRWYYEHKFCIDF